MDAFGGTYQADGKAADLGSVYIVADIGQEAQIDPANYGPEALADYALAHAEALAKPGHYLGVYYGGSGPVYLDVSIAYDNLIPAIQAGIAGGQESIWDNATSSLIYLDTERGRAEADRLGVTAWKDPHIWFPVS